MNIQEDLYQAINSGQKEKAIDVLNEILSKDDESLRSILKESFLTVGVFFDQGYPIKSSIYKHGLNQYRDEIENEGKFDFLHESVDKEIFCLIFAKLDEAIRARKIELH